MPVSSEGVVDTTTMLDLHRWMVWDRLLDTKLNNSFRAGKVMSMFHSASGQEAADVGAVLALQPGDALVPTYRGKAVFLMRGMDLKYLIAGSFGKKEGFGQGRSMTSSHAMGDRSKGLLPMQGGLGGAVANATGAALAFKVAKQPNAALCWSGDGASNRGDVHESMNLAAVLGLPAVFFFVNNGWSLSVPASYGVSVEHLSQRAASYGMRGITIDGTDPVEVYRTVGEALERARHDREPSVVEAMVRRGGAHSVNDPDSYRTDADRERDRVEDPVMKYQASLIGRGLLDDATAAALWKDIEVQIDEAIAYADACTEPGLEDLLAGVYEEES
ncbi:MAG: thiamine pyrophosphate-dependent dehydrogenase E1 component subunit alpha [Chloroflexi bacterium]|nr:thiamine pyrophosphate-dependent dehydrogenase E1 component subunit alpha [Chloroflexota bacterium]